MFKTIVIPTDGSDLATEAALAGVKFAQWAGASVVGVCVTAPYTYPASADPFPVYYPTKREYDKSVKESARQHLATIEEAAKKANVPFEAVTVSDARPADAIVSVAKRKKADLIYLGSHGRGGLGQVFLGSVTTKVLARCAIPVMVYRATGKGTAARRSRKPIVNIAPVKVKMGGAAVRAGA